MPSETPERVDWVAAFSQLKMWPFSCKGEEIARQTPRESFAMWRRLNEMREAISSIGKGLGNGEEGNEAPVRSSEPSKRETVPSSDQPPRKEAQDTGERKGIQAIGGGVDFAKYECFKPHPNEIALVKAGENPDIDPFCVPRELIAERTYSFVYEMTMTGQFENMGVPKGNVEACAIFFENIWKENCEAFETVKGAILNEDESAGRKSLAIMASHGRLKSYGIEPNMAVKAATEFFDHLRRCWARWNEVK